MRSASCPQFLLWRHGDGVTVMDRCPSRLLLCYLHALTLVLVTFLLCSPKSREWPSSWCTPAFLLTSTFTPFLEEPGEADFPNFFLFKRSRKEGGRRGKERERAQKLAENPARKWVWQICSILDFHLPVSWICQKSWGPAPTMNKIPKATVWKEGRYTSFSLQIIRGRSMQTEPRHKSLSSNYWREIKLMLEALKWVG